MTPNAGRPSHGQPSGEKKQMRDLLLRSTAGVILYALTTPVLAQDIAIAVVAPITGPLASFGEDVKRSATAGAQAVNEAGGVDGRKIRIVIEDDACDPKQAVTVANRIIGQGIKFVDGHTCSGASIAAAEVYADNNVLMMSGGSSNPALTEKGHPTIMRLFGRDDAQGAFAAAWIAENEKSKRIAILHDESAYGKGLATIVKETLNAAGISEVLFEGINPGEKDYVAVVTKLRSAGADFLYFGGYHTEAGLIVRQAAEQGYRPRVMAGDSLASSEF
jgi:branched-chain amino acid transport system substrate-binding protein